MVIFVTVGTGKFEELIKEIDRIAPKLKDKIIIQIGSGNYKPKNCKWFKFAPNLQKYYKQATLIIAHGGPGTVFEILDTGKKFIACANRDRTDPLHQVEFLEAISKESTSLLYCRNISQLKTYIEKAKKTKFKKYKKATCWMDMEVKKFIKLKTKKVNKLNILLELINNYFTLMKIIIKSGSKNIE
jgi:beta-1,4-N-acetylglucosaminyltransferase